jgi:hypothetical protein
MSRPIGVLAPATITEVVRPDEAAPPVLADDWVDG